jgi:hypothetical protein
MLGGVFPLVVVLVSFAEDCDIQFEPFTTATNNLSNSLDGFQQQ